MTKLKLNSVYGRIFIIALPFVCAAAVYLMSPLLIRIGHMLPSCAFHRITGFDCPGCGNTRSVIALLHGNILLSLRYNITPVAAILILLSFYAEPLFRAFDRRFRSPWRKDAVIIATAAVLMVYFVVRNFLLPV